MSLKYKLTITAGHWKNRDIGKDLGEGWDCLYDDEEQALEEAREAEIEAGFLAEDGNKLFAGMKVGIKLVDPKTQIPSPTIAEVIRRGYPKEN